MFGGSMQIPIDLGSQTFQGVLVPLKAGSAAFFWSQTMHKSGPNLTEHVRKAIVLQFAPVGLRHKGSGMNIRPRIAIARGGTPAV